MEVNEAKAFLVQQTIAQAALEGIELSDDEIRMISFTEEDDSTAEDIEQEAKLSEQDDPFKHFDIHAYESKIARLMSRAYVRIGKESKTNTAMWEESVRCLEKGDHFIVAIWDQRHARAERVKDLLKLAGIGLVLLVAILSAIMLAAGDDAGSKHSPSASKLLPVWVQHAILGLLAFLYLFFLVLPRQFAAAFGRIINPISRLFEDKRNR